MNGHLILGSWSSLTLILLPVQANIQSWPSLEKNDVPERGSEMLELASLWRRFVVSGPVKKSILKAGGGSSPISIFCLLLASVGEVDVVELGELADSPSRFMDDEIIGVFKGPPTRAFKLTSWSYFLVSLLSKQEPMLQACQCCFPNIDISVLI